MTSARTAPPNEADVLGALERRHAAPAWAFLRQVPSATGMVNGRTIDGLAMSLYPSLGLELHAFEVKVQRSDWLRELAQPDKSLPWVSACERFWVVAPAGVVRGGELPESWGLMTWSVRGGVGAVRVTDRAKRREPDPLSREQLAGLFRALHRGVTDEDRARKTGEAFHRGYTEGVASGKRTLEGLERRLASAEREQTDAVESWRKIRAVLRPYRWQETTDAQIAERVSALAALEKTIAEARRLSDSLTGLLARFDEPTSPEDL